MIQALASQRATSRWSVFWRGSAALGIVVLAAWTGWALGFSLWHAYEDGWARPGQVDLRLVLGWFYWTAGLLIVAGLSVAAVVS